MPHSHMMLAIRFKARAACRNFNLKLCLDFMIFDYYQDKPHVFEFFFKIDLKNRKTVLSIKKLVKTYFETSAL